jgi:hypothetical protein
MPTTLRAAILAHLAPQPMPGGADLLPLVLGFGCFALAQSKPGGFLPLGTALPRLLLEDEVPEDQVLAWLQHQLPCKPSLAARALDSGILHSGLVCALQHHASVQDWTLLYCDAVQGREFEVLRLAVTGYSGAWLLAVEDEEGYAFGALCTETFQGPASTMAATRNVLFSLKPCFQAYRQQTSIRALKARAQHLSAGMLAFGGESEVCPRLCLDAGYTKCRAGCLDRTYAPGSLRIGASAEQFVPRRIEIWGLGSVQDLQARDQAMAHEQGLRLARRTVDKAQFATTQFDRWTLLPGTFQHGQRELRD